MAIRRRADFGNRYTWAYWKSGSQWIGKVGDPVGLEFRPYFVARSEKTIRRKLARFIGKQRTQDFSRVESMTCSGGR